MYFCTKKLITLQGVFLSLLLLKSRDCLVYVNTYTLCKGDFHITDPGSEMDLFL